MAVFARLFQHLVSARYAKVIIASCCYTAIVIPISRVHLGATAITIQLSCCHQNIIRHPFSVLIESFGHRMAFSALNVEWDYAVTAQVVIAAKSAVEVSLGLVDKASALIASHHECSNCISTLHRVSHQAISVFCLLCLLLSADWLLLLTFAQLLYQFSE